VTQVELVTPATPKPKDYVKLRTVMAVISTVLALASLFIAFMIRGEPKGVRELHAQILVGFWALIPPVWFLLEWGCFTGPAETEHVKHCHELARNIWLALVVILAVIAGIKWPLGAD